MRSCLSLLMGFALVCCLANPASASFVIEPDIDGLDDGPNTPSLNFSFGGDTTAASTSIAVGSGVTPTSGPLIGTTGGDSIFGGNGGAEPDTYLYSYSPAADGDNTTIAAGIALNDDGDFSTGAAAGTTGVYRVYATFPQSQNVSDTTVQVALSTIFSTTAAPISLRPESSRMRM